METRKGRCDASQVTDTSSPTSTTQPNTNLTTIGYKLVAFISTNNTHLRHIRGGRQSLLRFERKHPTPPNTQYPPIWDSNSKAAGSTLETWMKIPNNSFVEGDGEESQNTTLEQERVSTKARSVDHATTRKPQQGAQTAEDLETKEMLRTIMDQILHLRNQMKETIQQNEEVKQQNEELKQQNEELKQQSEAFKERMEKQNDEHQERLHQVKAELRNLQETVDKSAEVMSIARSFLEMQPPRTETGNTTSNSSPRTYASILTGSINPESSASQQATGGTHQNDKSAMAVTIDTRRMNSTNSINNQNTTEIEANIKTAIDNIEPPNPINITGVQVRRHCIRVFTATEEEAQLLRTNDKWINQAFEGARLRGEEWYPIKLDDVAREAAVEKDGYTIKQSFADTFCAENGVNKVMKAFWLSKGNKPSGSMAVFLASANEAEQIINKRLVKVGGQIAFAEKYHRVARPVRCYNCNRYGHYQSKCKHSTTCGNCAGGHRTSTCTAQEKKCPACGEAHAVTDPGCPVYRKERDDLNRTGRIEEQGHVGRTHA
jgi:hypothetical protein